MALRGLLYCAAILIKKILVDSNAEIPCNGADIVVRDGLENFPGGMNKVPYLISLFNCVHKSECGVEIRYGAEKSMVRPDCRVVFLHQFRGGERYLQTSPDKVVVKLIDRVERLKLTGLQSPFLR